MPENLNTPPTKKDYENASGSKISKSDPGSGYGDSPSLKDRLLLLLGIVIILALIFFVLVPFLFSQLSLATLLWTLAFIFIAGLIILGVSRL